MFVSFRLLGVIHPGKSQSPIRYDGIRRTACCYKGEPKYSAKMTKTGIHNRSYSGSGGVGGVGDCTCIVATLECSRPRDRTHLRTTNQTGFTIDLEAIICFINDRLARGPISFTLKKINFFAPGGVVWGPTYRYSDYWGPTSSEPNDAIGPKLHTCSHRLQAASYAPALAMFQIYNC